MTTTAMPDRLELASLSGTAALREAARLWFLVAVGGQSLFAFTVDSRRREVISGPGIDRLSNYRKAFQLNPNNRTAAEALRKLGASRLGD